MAKKILLVDDEPDILNMVSLRLKANGYEVITGSSGQDALDLTKEHMPDLLIVDVNMPPPNGFQVCRTLKDDDAYKHIPIIFLTAKVSESDKFWGSESGADDYVTKPYNPQDLMEKIKNLIG